MIIYDYPFLRTNFGDYIRGGQPAEWPIVQSDAAFLIIKISKCTKLVDPTRFHRQKVDRNKQLGTPVDIEKVYTNFTIT